MTIYKTDATHKADVWGSFNIPSTATAFVVIGYYTGDATPAPVASPNIALYAVINSITYLLICDPGEIISVDVDGIGKITQLKDPGTRVRVITM